MNYHEPQQPDHFDNGSLDGPPYFERLETNEYIELQESRRIIEVLHHRVRSLENINIDLEYRLEQQAKATLAAESKYTDIDMSWRAKYEELEKETLEWQNKYVTQTQKTEKLREHLSRTERELYGILQRKYQLMRGGGGAPSEGMGSKAESTTSGGGNVQSLKQILSRSEQTSAQQRTNSTPLSTNNTHTEELCDVYKKLPPDMKKRRFLIDIGDFLGVS
eukprot:CAMPEP_0185018544 /NCGR_PEP_ID=MMETSP1103-20130426/1232_1 /TAXON_ID=36769 /ORGANISM="Paraphysomonas bandaiensis, Strain Caron Lab Isolate" /LENGTH=219 /DNA_ID=CAMNT_0027548387 /DNA_START=27 /DNA_END=686 /DNA_ORIENTATION=+